MVADSLQVGDQVGGQHDADTVDGDDLHEFLQELPARKRVERGDRLVQDQQLRPLRHGERQRELRALPAGQRAGALAEVKSELLDPAGGEGRVPRGIEPVTHL